MEAQQKYERPVSDPLRAFDSEQQESSGRRRPALVRYAALALSLIAVVTGSTWEQPVTSDLKPKGGLQLIFNSFLF